MKRKGKEESKWKRSEEEHLYKTEKKQRKTRETVKSNAEE
jgi:hypothetical protein